MSLLTHRELSTSLKSFVLRRLVCGTPVPNLANATLYHHVPHGHLSWRFWVPTPFLVVHFSSQGDQRNIQALLQVLASGRRDVTPTTPAWCSGPSQGLSSVLIPVHPSATFGTVGHAASLKLFFHFIFKLSHSPGPPHPTTTTTFWPLLLSLLCWRFSVTQLCNIGMPHG